MGTVQRVEAVERFAALAGGPEPAIPLDEAALVLAAATRGTGEVEAGLAALDALAAEVPAPTLDGLRALLFRDLGFAGNAEDYHDPANSWLDEVIERRVGIPITLAVLMLEVGRRVGIPLAGVSMPGHFLVRDKVDPGVYIDPFARGQVLDRGGCAARFHAVHGPGAVFDDAFLEPVGKRAILVRMLANLESVAGIRSDRELLLRAVSLRAAMPGAVLADHQRHATALAAGGRFREAAEVLDRYAAAGGSGSVAAAAERFRARLN